MTDADSLVGPHHESRTQHVRILLFDTNSTRRVRERSAASVVKDNFLYTVDNHEVLVVDGRSSAMRWHGQPDNAPAVNVLSIPDSSDGVVLLDYMSARGSFQNVVRIGPDGAVQWRAELPTSDPTEAYVEMEFHGQILTALSWSGHKVVLDTQTGRITSRQFVK